jgi:hypothetical protein
MHCSIYHAVASQCPAQSDRPDLAAGTKRNAEMYMAVAIQVAPDAEFNKQTMMAFNQHMTDAMRKAMSDDCTNVRVLMNAYNEFCNPKKLTPMDRLKQWAARAARKMPTCPAGPGILPEENE